MVFEAVALVGSVLSLSDPIGTALIMGFLWLHDGGWVSILLNFDRHALNDDERLTDDDAEEGGAAPERKNSSFNASMRTDEVERRRFVVVVAVRAFGRGLIEVLIALLSSWIAAVLVGITEVVVAVDKGWWKGGRVSLLFSVTIKTIDQ